MSLKRARLVALACSVALACNKAPAKDALAAAEQAFAAAPEIEAYLPEESRALKQVMRDARVRFDEGHYTEALRAVQPLSDRIAAAGREAARRKQHAVTDWNDLATRVPALLSALVARLTTLAPTDASPSERLLAAQAELAALTQAWTEANASLERGELAKAVAAGQEVSTRAQALATRIGVRLLPSGLPVPTPSPRPAPTPSPTPTPAPPPA
ncbi:MAG TPA: hypothetical protein VII62_03350 [Vicinamibacteria bacterium]